MWSSGPMALSVLDSLGLLQFELTSSLSVDLTISASFPQLNFDLDRGVFPVVIQAVVDEGDGEHCWSFLIFIVNCVGPVGGSGFLLPESSKDPSSGNCVCHSSHAGSLPCDSLRSGCWMRTRIGVESGLCQCCREREKVPAMTSHWPPLSYLTALVVEVTGHAHVLLAAFEKVSAILATTLSPRNWGRQW